MPKVMEIVDNNQDRRNFVIGHTEQSVEYGHAVVMGMVNPGRKELTVGMTIDSETARVVARLIMEEADRVDEKNDLICKGRA